MSDFPVRFCEKCRRAWQVLDSFHGLKRDYEYLPDFPTYKLERKICPQCRKEIISKIRKTRKKKSKKQLFLEYMADGKWHSNWELTQKFGWSFNQRKNELQRETGIQFEKKQSKKASSLWFYRLVTPPEDIDFENCCLKSQIEEEI